MIKISYQDFFYESKSGDLCTFSGVFTVKVPLLIRVSGWIYTVVMFLHFLMLCCD